MKATFNQIVFRVFITVVILIFSEFFSSAILPAIGFKDYTLAFNVLIVVYLGFRFNTSSLPWILLILQIFHSAFSVEGWALSTLAALIVCFVINYFKEIMQVSSLISTVVSVFAFQILWFLVVALVIGSKNGDFSLVLPRIMRIIPEAIGLALFSPILFKLMDKIWSDREDEGVRI